MGITREINTDHPITEQVFAYEPFHEVADNIRETFMEAFKSKYFRVPEKQISLDNRSEIWNKDKIITLVKKYKSNEANERNSIFDIGSGNGRFCTYIKSLQIDNTVT
jgi:hypothetical protein